jgi:hypothetical protein
MIENPDKRIISFLFFNPFPVHLNEFSLRLRKLFDNKLDEYLSETESKIASYIEKIRNDELDDEESDQIPFPITPIETPFLTFDITSVGRIGLTTADDPFFSLPLHHKKYFPEIILYNSSGEIIETIDEGKEEVDTISGGLFFGSCRKTKLKVNHDRKASLSLLLQKNVQMAVFVVRSKSLHGEMDIKQGEFDRAEFRLIDDETYQNLDHGLIKDMAVTLPTPEGEGDEEQKKEEEEEEEEGKEKPQNVIVVGRVFLENERWIYERYHYVFREDKRPNFFEQLGQIEKEARNFLKEKEAQIKEEEKLVSENREAAAQAAAAKAAGKKTKKSKKDEKPKKKDEKEEEKVEEKAEEIKQEIDIQYMPGFRHAIEGVYSTVFGPMEFDLREGKYNEEKTKNMILKKLKDEMKNKINDCIHGFEF